eukprot:CAMPEP_0202023022 /NCGR_PEP_ID=MMETSP0905-20130828/50904_1 /ASSEMBLY_ACC=CAM_ASM_000554 /TAXON_ID=420261 /ORGANISM="Thalassiosira antarctica, Strain CCMP982" /LENGTH=785 /DNA_ID=CAMNT_0048585307 /DNA_START=386 /DNA_END=2743 /DNA_ORIENTATION=-
MWDPTPVDAFLTSQSSIGNNDDEIRMALVITINTLIGSRSGFQHALGEIGSRKYFASLAVDAWFNEDFLCVRKFLIKSIILCHLQNAGAQNILAELSQLDGHNQQSRHSLLERVKGVVRCHEQGLKTVLESCTGGACLCIGLAQTLNEEKEILLNPSADREATATGKKQREVEQLPPILKPSSKYWIVKEKAAECLQKGKLDESSKLYLHAKTMLAQHKDLKAPMHQVEWLYMVGREIGKIASNLSMICLRRNLNQKALEYADEAVLACPGWSKSFCRRALALKSLGRPEEAQLAIFNAIKKFQGEMSRGEDGATERQLKEYQKIQKDIEVELCNSSSTGNINQQQSLPVENPLYKPWNFELVGNQVESIGFLSGNQGIMDVIYSFLTPTDVANLERTCKRFATNVERGRRIAIGSKLLFVKYSSKQPSSCLGGNDDDCAVAIENSLVKYFNAIDDSSTKALRDFVSEVHHMIDDEVWKEYIAHVKMDPLSFNTILVAAFSNTSATGTQLLFEILDLDFVSSRDFQIAKFLLQGDNNACGSLKHIMLSQMSHLDDDDYFLRGFVQHSLDLEVMRLAVSIDDDDDDDNDLQSTVFVVLNNFILSKGGHRRQNMDQDDPIFVHTMAFHSLYTEHIPADWPGLIGSSFSWKNDSIKKDSIKQYWIDENPTMFRMWKVAILKLLKWVHDVEKEGCIFEYLLVSRVMLGEMIDLQHSPISNFSFGPFLVMKAMEYGGAVSLSVRLRNEDDFTDLFCDYYNFLNLYSTGFPALIERRDRLLAAHHSYSGYR